MLGLIPSIALMQNNSIITLLSPLTLCYLDSFPTPKPCRLFLTILDSRQLERIGQLGLSNPCRRRAGTWAAFLVAFRISWVSFFVTQTQMDGQDSNIRRPYWWTLQTTTCSAFKGFTVGGRSHRCSLNHVFVPFWNITFSGPANPCPDPWGIPAGPGGIFSFIMNVFWLHFPTSYSLSRNGSISVPGAKVQVMQRLEIDTFSPCPPTTDWCVGVVLTGGKVRRGRLCRM